MGFSSPSEQKLEKELHQLCIDTKHLMESRGHLFENDLFKSLERVASSTLA